MRSCFALIFLLLLIVGCNSEYAQLSAMNKTQIKVTASLPTGITADKIMLWGQNANGNQFARVIEADEEETFVFDNGSLTLYAIAWTASGMTGDVYCSTSPNALTGPDLNLTLNLTNANCSATHFKGASATTVPETLGSVNLELCESVSGLGGYADACTDDLANASRKTARGHSMSYRYVLKTFDKTKNKYSLNSDVVMSNCLQGTPFNALSLSGLAFGIGSQIPFGDGSNTPFYFTLESFPRSSSCDATTGKVTTTFQNGLKQDSSTVKYFGNGNDHKLFLRMSSSEICGASAATETFAGGNGNNNSPYLICNPTQFYNMHTSRVSSFKLLNDIDLTPYYYGLTTLPNIPNGLTCLDKGSNFIPLGWDTGSCSYSGEAFYTSDFDGGGKTIKGLRISIPTGLLVGLYTRKFGGEIRRLKLESAYIKGNAYVGGLVGETSASIRDISIDKSNIETTSSNVGGIAGTNSIHPNNCEFKNILINRTNINSALGNAGGIIGESNSCDFKSISVSANVVGTSSNVGGIAGLMSHGIVNETSFEGFVKGFTSVGGITGYLLEIQLLASKVVGNIQVTNTGVSGRTGGLVGYTNGAPNVSTSYVMNSYFFGQITHFCTAIPASDCEIGNIVGDPGGWGPGDFVTNFYLSSNSTNGKSPIASGTSRSRTTFVNTATVFPTNFTKTGDIPRLPHEVTVGTMDMRHPCQSNSNAWDTVANQVAAGKGNSADNPVGLCNFSQVNDMQDDTVLSSKFYKVYSPIIMETSFGLSLNEFTGQLDGDYKPFVRMDLYGAAAFNTSWWKTIGTNAVVKNLYLLDTRIHDNGPSSTTAALAETNNGTIDRVYMLGTISEPLNGGEHGLLVHTNNGTISNSYIGGTATVTNRMAAVAYKNRGTIEDMIVNTLFTCTSGTNCFRVSGLTSVNTGTIRRVDVNSQIVDASGTVGASDFTFVTTYNEGLIEDVQIKPTSNILARSYSAHGIARENSADGVIRRIFNEGSVTVYNAALPFIAPLASFGDIDFIEGASGGIGFSFPGGAVDDIAYTKRGRWSFPSQQGYVTRTPMASSCQYILSGDLPAAWETAMSNAAYYSRFGIMVSVNEDPFNLVGTPSFFPLASDTFTVDDASPCSMTVGNPTVYFWPYDFRNGADLITKAQRLNFGTFSSWGGTFNITTDDTVYHQAKHNELKGVSQTKPIWLFDTTNSMRLYR